MMRKQIAIAAFIVGATSGTAHAYDIGHLTCQNVGQLAAHMLIARKSGVPPQDYLSALNNQLPADATTERELARDFAKLAAKLASNGMIWIAWPKKSSGVATDLSFERVQRIGLDAGLVDVKICAIDDTWSGLKFVIRLRDRK